MRYMIILALFMLIAGCSVVVEDPEQSNERIELAHSREERARELRLAEEARTDRIRLETLAEDSKAKRSIAWAGSLPIILFVLFSGVVGCLIAVCHIIDAGTRRHVAQIAVKQQADRLEYREVQPTDNEIIVYREY